MMIFMMAFYIPD